MSGYTKAETVVRSFAVTNDSAERNVKLMQDFIPMCENVDEQQALFQVVEQYRNKQSEEKTRNRLIIFQIICFKVLFFQ